MEVLYLSNNKIEDLGNVFKRLRKLRFLHLERNRIKRLTDNVFVDLINLKELYLENNNIVHVHLKTFQETKSLMFLNMSHNEYTADDKPDLIGSLLGKFNLRNVDLSYNKIKFIKASI